MSFAIRAAVTPVALILFRDRDLRCGSPDDRTLRVGLGFLSVVSTVVSAWRSRPMAVRAVANDNVRLGAVIPCLDARGLRGREPNEGQRRGYSTWVACVNATAIPPVVADRIHGADASQVWHR